MTIEKCKDFVKDGYGTCDDTSKPTTYANMYDFMKNQNNVVMNLAKGLWQPNTAYAVGASVTSPAIPAGCIARCVTAGTSSEAEPTWPARGENVTDGTVKWLVEDTVLSNIMATVNNALASLHSTITKEVKTSMLALFPVGTIIESLKDVNPGTYIGGTWELLPAGLTTISAGTYTETHNVNGTDVTDTYVFTAGSSEFTVNGTKTQGEAKHQITEGELASHTHTEYTDDLFCAYQTGNNNKWKQGLVNAEEKSKSVTYEHWIGSAGGNQPHNNLPPFYSVFRFRRTT